MITMDISGRLPHGVTKPFIESIVKATYNAVSDQRNVQITLSVIDDREMRALNNQYRGLDKTTDVLSFPYLLEEDDDFVGGADDAVNSLLGEIVISAEQIRRQAKSAGQTIKAEFALMLAHGTLHLLGYDHCTSEDETEMFRLQKKVLEDQGIE